MQPMKEIWRRSLARDSGSPSFAMLYLSAGMILAAVVNLLAPPYLAPGLGLALGVLSIVAIALDATATAANTPRRERVAMCSPCGHPVADHDDDGCRGKDEFGELCGCGVMHL